MIPGLQFGHCDRVLWSRLEGVTSIPRWHCDRSSLSRHPDASAPNGVVLMRALASGGPALLVFYADLGWGEDGWNTLDKDNYEKKPDKKLKKQRSSLLLQFPASTHWVAFPP